MEPASSRITSEVHFCCTTVGTHTAFLRFPCPLLSSGFWLMGICDTRSEGRRREGNRYTSSCTPCLAVARMQPASLCGYSCFSDDPASLDPTVDLETLPVATFNLGHQGLPAAAGGQSLTSLCGFPSLCPHLLLHLLFFFFFFFCFLGCTHGLWKFPG